MAQWYSKELKADMSEALFQVKGESLWYAQNGAGELIWKYLKLFKILKCLMWSVLSGVEHCFTDMCP